MSDTRQLAMTAEELATYRAAYEASTKGTWHSTWEDGDGTAPETHPAFGEESIIVVADAPPDAPLVDRFVLGTMWHDGPHPACTRENAAFIVKAHNEAPRLLALIAGLEHVAAADVARLADAGRELLKAAERIVELKSEVAKLNALVAELQATNEVVSADRDQCAARVAELDARLTAAKGDASGNERLHLGALADLHGLESRLLRAVGAVHVPDSSRWRWPGEEQAFSSSAAVERALACLRAASSDGAAKEKASPETDTEQFTRGLGTAPLMKRFEHLRDMLKTASRNFGGVLARAEKAEALLARLTALKVKVVDECALQEVAPWVVEAYLASKPQWKRLAPVEPFFIWKHDASWDHVTVPKRQTWADYGQRLLECLHTIAQAEERPQLAVLVDLWNLVDKQADPAKAQQEVAGDQ